MFGLLYNHNGNDVFVLGCQMCFLNRDNPNLGNLHWPTVKGVKDWDERNNTNGYVPLQLLDAPNLHMLSKKEIQIYYKPTNGGEVLVDRGLNVLRLLGQGTDVTTHVL